jgi:hypothetical protein
MKDDIIFHESASTISSPRFTPLEITPRGCPVAILEEEV